MVGWHPEPEAAQDRGPGRVGTREYLGPGRIADGGASTSASCKLDRSTRPLAVPSPPLPFLPGGAAAMPTPAPSSRSEDRRRGGRESSGSGLRCACWQVYSTTALVATPGMRVPPICMCVRIWCIGGPGLGSGSGASGPATAAQGGQPLPPSRLPFSSVGGRHSMRAREAVRSEDCAL